MGRFACHHTACASLPANQLRDTATGPGVPCRSPVISLGGVTLGLLASVPPPGRQGSVVRMAKVERRSIGQANALATR